MGSIYWLFSCLFLDLEMEVKYSNSDKIPKIHLLAVRTCCIDKTRTLAISMDMLTWKVFFCFLFCFVLQGPIPKQQMTAGRSIGLSHGWVTLSMTQCRVVNPKAKTHRQQNWNQPVVCLCLYIHIWNNNNQRRRDYKNWEWGCGKG